MRQVWKALRIGDLGKIVTGRTPSTSQPRYFGDKYPFITPSDMIGQKKANITQRYLSEDGAKLLQKNLLPSGSVAVSCIGWQMGKAIMTSRPSYTNQQLNTIIPNDMVDADFLYYSLSVRKVELLSLGSATGVRTPILNKSAFSNLKIRLPPLPTQRKITAVLSAYDDLIENNTRRIRILEQMAQAVYREWFVHFRFPGHEGARMVDGVPAGWEAVKLGDACNIVMGQSPESKFYNENGEGLPFHQGVTNFGDRFPIDRVFCTVQNRLAEKGDILFSVRAPVGRLNVTNKRIVIGRGLSAIRSKTGHQGFIFQQLKEQFQEEDMMGGGTIFKAVTKEDMFGIKILLPPKQLVEQFENFVRPISLAIDVLTAKNVNLRRTRDLLLPRLVGGEVAVSELDIQME